ncbi:heme-binding protein 2-like [Ylistrum balloti]|uniref:heme-binding protein 2-like n=1 Tax=Ylistrum balloti TaxID=509963 RepID=UPI002905AA3D|nr:heme-binding protein 2-like [Ylistrum balloti]
MDRSLILSSIMLILMKSESEASVIPRIDSSCPENVRCPTYIIIREKSTNDYEYRRYDESKWIATRHISASLTADAETEMHALLDGYFNRENTERAIIEQTQPVVLRVAPNIFPDGRSVFVMFRMIPPAVHGNVPEPTAASVHIQEVPSFNVYVRQFSGCLVLPRCQNEVVRLQNDTRNSSLYYQGYFLLAGFESSTRERVNNEAWLVSTEHVLQDMQ